MASDPLATGLARWQPGCSRGDVLVADNLDTDDGRKVSRRRGRDRSEPLEYDTRSTVHSRGRARRLEPREKRSDRRWVDHCRTFVARRWWWRHCYRSGFVREHPAVPRAAVLRQRDDHFVFDAKREELIVPVRPDVGVAADRPPPEGEVCLHLERTSLSEERRVIGRDHFQVRELSDGGLVADAGFSRDGVGVFRRKRLPTVAKTLEHAEDERRRHEKAAGEHLRQLLALDGCRTENVFFAIEGEAVPVIEPPMSDLVSGGVPLERDGALRRHEHATDTFGDKGAEEVVHRQERKPQTEVLAHTKDIDLLCLIYGQLVKEASGRLRSLDASLPATSLRGHDLLLSLSRRGAARGAPSDATAWLSGRCEKLGEPENLFPIGVRERCGSTKKRFRIVEVNFLTEQPSDGTSVQTGQPS
jgi:hypothetical protein